MFILWTGIVPDIPKNTLYPAPEKEPRNRAAPNHQQRGKIEARPVSEKMSTEAVDKSVEDFAENPCRAPRDRPYCLAAHFLTTPL
jgi:hypothetical protein